MNLLKKLRWIGYSTLVNVLMRLSIEGNARVGAVLGHLLWLLLPGRRRVATESIRRHLGLDQIEARRMAKASFINNARSFLEILLVPKMDRAFVEQRVHIDNMELFQTLMSYDRPTLLITAHLGAWELCAGLTGLYMAPDRVKMVVVRRPKDEEMHRMIKELRGSPGLEILDHRRAAPKVLRGLAKNGVCAFLVDHNCSVKEAIFLPFLDEVAAVNSGPALLGVRAEAMICPGCVVRDKETGRYRVLLAEPLDTSLLEGSREDKVRQVAEYYTREVEKFVRSYPEQWFWMHKRWKTRPQSA